MGDEQVDKSKARSARVIIEVVAGLLPGKDPDPEFTRRYAVFSDDWAAAEAVVDDPAAQARLLAETNGRALGYAALLMMQPARVNWVRTDWIYV